MENLICNDTIEYTMKTIDFLRKVKHIRPTTDEEYTPERKNYVDKININAGLRSLRVKNLNKLIIGRLNINSLRNKFALLTHQVKDNIDILMISETKLDESFSKSVVHEWFQ